MTYTGRDDGCRDESISTPGVLHSCGAWSNRDTRNEMI